MTTQQPEALRLTQVAPYLENGERGQWIMSAAAELRRLQSVNAELLAALKGLNSHGGMSAREQIEIERFVKVAIAKAESKGATP
jgi:hypothetical protein